MDRHYQILLPGLRGEREGEERGRERGREGGGGEKEATKGVRNREREG